MEQHDEINEMLMISNENAFEINEVNNEEEEDLATDKLKHIDEMAISGTDWTSETIVNQMDKGNIILDPDFQRRDAWTDIKKSRFIESLILGLPIPQIILAENKENKGTFIVIDGKQRLLSLLRFMGSPENGGSDLRLKGMDVRKDLNGKTYKEMQEEGLNSDIRSLTNQTIRTVVIKNWPSIEVLYLIFLRLNTESVRLSPQELRQALHPGEFIQYANEQAPKSEAINVLLNNKNGTPDFRMRDVEIFIRYIAFQFFAKEYNGSMQSFLDNTCIQMNKKWDEYKVEVIHRVNEMEKATDFVHDIFGKNAFCKYKTDRYESKPNRAVMDVMLYYFADEKIRDKSIEKKQEIKNAFEKICKEDEQFLDAIQQTTKSMSSVGYRFTKWAEVLSEILDVQINSPVGER